ncbi:MAG: L,D-transpeptidase family protein [Gemmatimonadales bacterium]
MTTRNPRAKALHILFGTTILLSGCSVSESGTRPAATKRPSFAGIWVERSGKPNKASRDAIALLLAAPADGLDSTFYGAPELAARARALTDSSPPRKDAVTEFDTTLTRSMLTFLRDLHLGRVDPRRTGFELKPRKETHDVEVILRAAADRNAVDQLVNELRPSIAQYGRLREALGRYRLLADSAAAWTALPTVRRAVKPGARYAGLATVAARLAALGDLPSSDLGRVNPSVYAPPLVAGVIRFQGRHGLEPDGLLTPATITALDVSPAERRRQLALSLERLRWLPDLDTGRVVLVNIPTFHLWAWDVGGGETSPALDMRVIVGTGAFNRQTPVFVDEMRYLVFRPYWDIPPGITKNEIIPAMQKDRSYLARHDMEVVPVSGGGTADQRDLGGIEDGRLRVRQRPGAQNALGLVKFIFPNDENVYLHGTPQDELFAKARRDFSHGCVRVEQPVELAEWVLRGVPGWDQTTVLDAMHGEASKRVNLAAPVRVILFYTTAMAEQDGTVSFYEDIYDHDPRLLEAMETAPRHEGG